MIGSTRSSASTTNSGKIEVYVEECVMATKTRHPVDAKGQRIDVEGVMAMIEKSQQLAGHFPNSEALSRARRVLEGESTEAEANAELDAKYRT
jgi:hypothetical protein